MSKASEKSTGLILGTKGGGSMVASSALPAHLAQHAGAGLETLKEFVRPGRVKVMQSNRSEKYAGFKDGQVIITPTNDVLAEIDKPFWFVPLFFFPEWCTVNPYQMKGSLNMIRARSLDPSSEIARKSRDADLRGKDQCPENPKFNLKHVEYLNFVIWLVQTDVLSRTPLVMAFSKGEHSRGSTLANFLAGRGGPIWGNVFEGKVPKQKRSSGQGEWYGIDVSNPTTEGAPPPFVMDPGEAEELRLASESLKKAHAAKLLIVDHEEDEAEDAVEDGSGKFA